MSSEVEAAQVRLDAIRRKFEARFKVYPAIGNTAHAPTGEKYVEICPGCDWTGKIEGGRNPTFTSALEALEAYDCTLEEIFPIDNAFKGRNSIVLYWRILPEIDVYEGRWKIYSRFLVSAKQPLYGACRSQEEREFCFPPASPIT